MRYIYVNIQALSHANIIGSSNYLGDNEVYLFKCTVISHANNIIGRSNYPGDNACIFM